MYCVTVVVWTNYSVMFSYLQVFRKMIWYYIYVFAMIKHCTDKFMLSITFHIKIKKRQFLLKIFFSFMTFSKICIFLFIFHVHSTCHEWLFMYGLVFLPWVSIVLVHCHKIASCLELFELCSRLKCSLARINVVSVLSKIKILLPGLLPRFSWVSMYST